MLAKRLVFRVVLPVIVAAALIYVVHRGKVELGTLHADRARIALAMGETATAMDGLRTAVRLNRRLHHARGALADLYEQQGDHASALRVLQDGVRADGRSVVARGNLGFAHYNAGEYQDALTTYQACVRLQPDNLFWRTLVGRSHARLGDTARAREELEYVLKIQPDNDAARHGLDTIINAPQAP